jgi:hypothetical protein
MANPCYGVGESPQSQWTLSVNDLTSSPVPGFEELAQQFLTTMTARGMRTVKSTEFLI